MINQRSVVLWYVLSIVTFGIATIIWYYKINADAPTRWRQASSSCCYVPIIHFAYWGVLQSSLNQAATEEVPGTVSATA